MPSSYLMRDVIVCIPGITGSVLRKDGKDIWNVSGGAILNALRTLGGSVKELKLEEDPVDADDVDGITATSVIRDVHLIPGLWKIDGYTKLVRHIEERFDVKHGEICSSSPTTGGATTASPRASCHEDQGLARRGEEVREPRREAHPHRPLDGRTRRASLHRVPRVARHAHPRHDRDAVRGSLYALGTLANGKKVKFFDLTEIALAHRRLSAAADLPLLRRRRRQARARRGGADPESRSGQDEGRALSTTRFATPSRRT